MTYVSSSSSCFASHLIQNGTLKLFRESFDSERDFKARFASHLIQNGTSKRISRESLIQNWASQSAFRESFNSERGFKKHVSLVI